MSSNGTSRKRVRDSSCSGLSPTSKRERIADDGEAMHVTDAMQLASDSIDNNNNNNSASSCTIAPSTNPTTNSIATLIGKEIPTFRAKAVVSSGLVDFDLASMRSQNKKVLLVFFPLAFTFVCPTELVELSRRESAFAAANCQIVGVSVDSEYALLAWRNLARSVGGLGGDVPYPLVSDVSNRISRSLGCYVDEFGHTSRSLYLVDSSGVLQYVSHTDDSVGRNFEQLLEVVQQVK
jgi:peroxiredoxin 2/4